MWWFLAMPWLWLTACFSTWRLHGHCVQNPHGSNNKNAASGWGPQHTPWKIPFWNPKMEVWVRWFSVSTRWFLGSMLIFRGVHVKGKARKTNTCSWMKAWSSWPPPVKLDMFDLWIWGLENVALQLDEVLEMETGVIMFRILNTFAVRVD